MNIQRNLNYSGADCSATTGANAPSARFLGDGLAGLATGAGLLTGAGC